MSEETKHSPEPFSLIDHTWAETTIYDANDLAVCLLSIRDVATEETQAELEARSDANARRIVECVNYCQGATKLSGTLYEHEMEMLSRAAEAELFRDEAEARAEAAEKQRDGLLAALERIAEAPIPPNDVSTDSMQAVCCSMRIDAEHGIEQYQDAIKAAEK